MMRNSWLYISPVVVLLVLLTGLAQNSPTSQQSPHDKSAEAKSDDKSDDKRKEAIQPTPEQEQAAREFVAQHHSQLVQLLDYLQANQPKKYAAAVLDLFRTSDRLAQTEKRDVERYALELRLWQTRTRSELIAARLQMIEIDNDRLRDQLKNLLNQEVDIRLQIHEHERKRLAARSEKIEEQMRRVADGREAFVEKHLRLLTKPAKTKTVNVKTGRSDTAASKSTTPPDSAAKK